MRRYPGTSTACPTARATPADTAQGCECILFVSSISSPPHTHTSTRRRNRHADPLPPDLSQSVPPAPLPHARGAHGTETRRVGALRTTPLHAPTLSSTHSGGERACRDWQRHSRHTAASLHRHRRDPRPNKRPCLCNAWDTDCRLVVHLKRWRIHHGVPGPVPSTRPPHPSAAPCHALLLASYAKQAWRRMEEGGGTRGARC